MTINGIQTVQGIITKEELGFCHSHEHLFLARGKPAELNPALRIDDFAKTEEELLMFKSIGGRAIVDAQPVGCGRMADLLAEASKQTGVHIIASTGFHKPSFYYEDHWLFRYDETRLIELFVKEIEQGMYVNTEHAEPTTLISAKAGVIKIAVDRDLPNQLSEKLMTASAHASLETGIPLMCHIESNRQGIFAAEYFMKLGIHPRSIIVCHMDRKLNDLGLHKQLAAYGVFLEYDTIGRYKYHSDEEEVKLIIQMLEWGFENALLLGLDTTRDRLKSYGGQIGLDHITNIFLPMLRQRGVPEKAITSMMITNPAKAFSRQNRNEE